VFINKRAMARLFFSPKLAPFATFFAYGKRRLTQDKQTVLAFFARNCYNKSKDQGGAI